MRVWGLEGFSEQEFRRVGVMGVMRVKGVDSALFNDPMRTSTNNSFYSYPPKLLS